MSRYTLSFYNHNYSPQFNKQSSAQLKASKRHPWGRFSELSVFPFQVKNVFPCADSPQITPLFLFPLPSRGPGPHQPGKEASLTQLGNTWSAVSDWVGAKHARSEKSGREGTPTVLPDPVQARLGLLSLLSWKTRVNLCSKPLKQLENTALYVALQNKLAQNEKWYLVSGWWRVTCPAPRAQGPGWLFSPGSS